MLNKREDDIIRYLSGNFTSEDKQAFESELANNASLKALLDEYAVIWQQTNQLNYPSEMSNQSWTNFQQNVKAPIRFLGFDWLNLAASLTILAAIFVGIWFLTASHSTTYTAGTTVLSKTLIDQTHVVLKQNSELTVAENFDQQKREVWLSGEAYFEVEKSDKPFIVHTKNGDIKVLGTKFSVTTDNKKSILIAELYQGSIVYAANNKQVVLVPGQRLQSLEQTEEISEIENLAPNLENNISCKDASLAYILSKIKIQYNVDFDIKPKYLSEHYTLSLPSDNLASCLNILSMVSSKKFVIRNNLIVLE